MSFENPAGGVSEQPEVALPTLEEVTPVITPSLDEDFFRLTFVRHKALKDHYLQSSVEEEWSQLLATCLEERYGKAATEKCQKHPAKDGFVVDILEHVSGIEMQEFTASFRESLNFYLPEWLAQQEAREDAYRREVEEVNAYCKERKQFLLAFYRHIKLGGPRPSVPGLRATSAKHATAGPEINFLGSTQYLSGIGETPDCVTSAAESYINRNFPELNGDAYTHPTDYQPTTETGVIQRVIYLSPNEKFPFTAEELETAVLDIMIEKFGKSNATKNELRKELLALGYQNELERLKTMTKK
ncbi:MAG: hypothetical protein Q7R83_03360 [bacterium]|nr:hypothetical protein [bacterium]